MTALCLGAVRSCGVTTLATGLALLWPGDNTRLLIEADPHGGTLAATTGLALEPGLVTLAAAARRRDDPALAFEHTQDLFGLPVVCGPAGSERARSALAVNGHLLEHIGTGDGTVVIDCGRLDSASAQQFRSGDLCLLATRPRLADLSALAAFVEALPTSQVQGAQPATVGGGGRQPAVAPSPLLVLMGDGPYPATEVAETFGLTVAGTVPWDPEAAVAIGTRALGSRRLSRLPLVRALRTLADELAAQLAARSSAPEAKDATGDPATVST